MTPWNLQKTEPLESNATRNLSTLNEENQNRKKQKYTLSVLKNHWTPGKLSLMMAARVH